VARYALPGGIVVAVDVTRAVTARKLATELSNMAALAAQLADEAVWELTRVETHADVAEALGVSLPTVRKAIQVHNRRRALTERTDSGKSIRAKVADHS